LSLPEGKRDKITLTIPDQRLACLFSTHLIDLDGTGQGRSTNIILKLVYATLYNPCLAVHIKQTHPTQKWLVIQ
jgi:hypothetical protein